MVHFNKITVQGILADAPVFSGSGSEVVAQFTIATALRFTNQENVVVEQTQWFRVTLVGALAHHLEKEAMEQGDPIYVDGRLSVFEYVEDGKHMTSLEIYAYQFAALNSTNAPQPSGEEPPRKPLPIERYPSEYGVPFP